MGIRMTQGSTWSRNIISQSGILWQTQCPVLQSSGPRLQREGGKAAGCLPQGEVGAQVPSYSTVHSAGELTWGVDETLAQLEKVLHLYWSGQYLQNSTEAGRAGEWPRRGSRGWGGGEQVRGWVIPLIGEVAHPPSETAVYLSLRLS